MESLKHLCLNKCMFMKIPNNYLPKELIEDIKTAKFNYLNNIYDYKISWLNKANDTNCNEYIKVRNDNIWLIMTGSSTSNKLLLTNNRYNMNYKLTVFNFNYMRCFNYIRRVNINRYNNKIYIIYGDYNPDITQYGTNEYMYANGGYYGYKNIKYKQDLIYKKDVCYNNAKTMYGEI